MWVCRCVLSSLCYYLLKWIQLWVPPSIRWIEINTKGIESCDTKTWWYFGECSQYNWSLVKQTSRRPVNFPFLSLLLVSKRACLFFNELYFFNWFLVLNNFPCTYRNSTIELDVNWDWEAFRILPFAIACSKSMSTAYHHFASVLTNTHTSGSDITSLFTIKSLCKFTSMRTFAQQHSWSKLIET